MVGNSVRDNWMYGGRERERRACWIFGRRPSACSSFSEVRWRTEYVTLQMLSLSSEYVHLNLNLLGEGEIILNRSVSKKNTKVLNISGHCMYWISRRGDRVVARVLLSIG